MKNAQPDRRRRTILPFFLLCTTAFANTLSPDTVLLRLSSTERQLHAGMRQPATADHLALARTALQSARLYGDSRYAGQAEGLMRDVASTPNSELLYAEIEQFLHRFDEADRRLTRLLEHEPQNVNARLLAANIAFTQGDAMRASHHCRRLISNASHLLSHSCVAYAESLSGKLPTAYRFLSAQLANFDANPAELAWALQLLADMAERLGDDRAAQRYYEQAVQHDPDNVSALAALADLLLRRQQAERVVTLLTAHQHNDVLLLRYLYAKRVMKQRQTENEAELAARFARLQQRGDRGHERELALHAWWLLDQPEQALALARDNVRQQRETVDIRLLMTLATTLRRDDIKTDMRQTLARTQYEDVVIHALGNGAIP